MIGPAPTRLADVVEVVRWRVFLLCCGLIMLWICLVNFQLVEDVAGERRSR